MGQIIYIYIYIIQLISSYNNNKILRIIRNKQINSHTNMLLTNINTLKFSDLVEKKH